MPPIPDVTLTIKDGSLGVLPEDTSGLSVRVGVSSLGDPNTLYSFTDKADLVETLGVGPLVEAAAYHLDVSGQPVLCVPVTSSVAGDAGDVTHTGTGTATLAITGEPLDAYDVIVEMLQGGATLVAATATFRYSLDGGDTYSPEIAVPTSGEYEIPNTGMTLDWTYVSGTAFVADDTFTFTTTAPGYSLSDLNDALDALLADSREWGFVHVVGDADASVAAGVATKMAAAESAYRFAFALLEARDVDLAGAETEAAWMADLIDDFGDTADPRVMVAAGAIELASVTTGRLHRRSCGWVIAARIAKAPISEDLGRVASGAVPGVSSLYHDEQVTPGLDAARFATMRTIIGRQGFYITAGKMMAAAGSDFGLVQRRRVMDRASKVARDGFLTFLNDKVLVDAAGKIQETRARAIEKYVTSLLEGALTSDEHASATSAKLDRSVNVLSTEKLKATVTVTPAGYARAIEVTIGFANPALTLS